MRDRKEKNGLVSRLPSETSPHNTPLILFHPHLSSPVKGEEDERGFYPII
jgi:hypothetical protein